MECFCKARRETLQSYDLDDLIAQTMRCHEFRKPQLRILLEGMRPRTCMPIDGSAQFVFFPPCHETLDRRVSPEGCGYSSQERCCGFLSTGTSSLQMNVTDNFKTVPVVNFEVASTQKDMLQIFS